MLFRDGLRSFSTDKCIIVFTLDIIQYCSQSIYDTFSYLFFEYTVTTYQVVSPIYWWSYLFFEYTVTR